MMKELKAKNFVSDDHFDDLMGIAGPHQTLLSRQILKQKGLALPRTYSPELKAFAMNLNFYSPKAYNYVRTVFNSCLPHEKTLSNWYKGIDTQPGFSKEAFLVLEKVAKSSNTRIIVNLVFDEMAIRPQREWDGKQSYGNVDIGNGIPSDILATQVFVLMVVGVNTSWKLPVGWFPIVSLSGVQKKNLVSMCMELLLSIDIEVVGITSDGISTNCTLATLLGCNLQFENLNSTFQLQNRNTKFCFFLDACHMVKLVRNTLAEKGPLVDLSGNYIDWKYLNQLQVLQDEEGMHLGNKITKTHILFQKQKIKVKLATQCFSDSVCDALQFCKTGLNIKQFEHCDGTITFLRHMNRIFDILNSRSLRKSCFKKCICDSNYLEVHEYVKLAI